MQLRALFLIISLILSCSYFGKTQEVINLYNPSFEDIPKQSSIVRGWNDCGFIGESAPDVQPGIWEVDLKAQDGNTFLGMVTRDNDTWERVSQRLVRPLKGDKCYSFSAHLAAEDHYISLSTMTGDTVNYNTPIVLRIWGGKGVCDKAQLLAESKPVDHNNWKKYNFKLEPNSDYNYIILEAFYDVPVLVPPNGNILIDDLSELRMIPCDKTLIASVEAQREKKSSKKKKAPTKSLEERGSEKHEIVKSTEEKFEPKLIKELNHENLKEGQRIKIRNLHFETDSTNITPESKPVLDEIYTFLNTHEDVKIEIGGHTNSLPPEYYCKRLSEARAQSVANYLIEMGIDSSRITYKGYGKKNPIASNETLKGRKKNQRCEIKIVSIGDIGSID